MINERYGERQWAVIWQPTEKPLAEIELTVAQGQVFVLGDSRSRSSDSRSFGTVPLQDVLGKARQVWFASGDQGIRWDRLGAVLQ